MKTCCVPSCDSTFSRNGELSFHQFPKDEHTKNTWILLIQSRGGFPPGFNWEPARRSMVCCKHFAPECFSVSTTRRILLPRSIPTIFGELCRRRQPRKKSNKKKRRHEEVDDLVGDSDSSNPVQQECDSTSSSPFNKDVAIQVNSTPIKPSKKKTIIIKIGLIKRQRKTISKLKGYIVALKEALRATGTNV